MYLALKGTCSGARGDKEEPEKHSAPPLRLEPARKLQSGDRADGGAQAGEHLHAFPWRTSPLYKCRDRATWF